MDPEAAVLGASELLFFVFHLPHYIHPIPKDCPAARVRPHAREAPWNGPTCLRSRGLL